MRGCQKCCFFRMGIEKTGQILQMKITGIIDKKIKKYSDKKEKKVLAFSRGM